MTAAARVSLVGNPVSGTILSFQMIEMEINSRHFAHLPLRETFG